MSHSSRGCAINTKIVKVDVGSGTEEEEEMYRIFEEKRRIVEDVIYAKSITPSAPPHPSPSHRSSSYREDSEEINKDQKSHRIHCKGLLAKAIIEAEEKGEELPMEFK